MAEEQKRDPAAEQQPADPHAVPPQGAEGTEPAGELSFDFDAVAVQARLDELQNDYLRAQAEMANVRRRADEEVAKARKFAVEGFAEALLPVADSLEAALATEQATPEQLRQGAELTLQQLKSAFERYKLVPIDPLGERFDPNRHQAISMAPSADIPAQHVCAVLQKGWSIADRTLRPALVTVSNGPAPA